MPRYDYDARANVISYKECCEALGIAPNATEADTQKAF